jgi:hypothetical protein
MAGAQNKIVSIDAFRASRTAGHTTGTIHRGTSSVRPQLSPRNVEHRERMLQFLRMEAIARREARVQKEAQETQGRLLL